MKQLTVVYSDENGEVQGVFDGDTLLSWWCSSDADLRVEYHGKLFEKLGYKLVRVSNKDRTRLCKILDEVSGQ